LIHNLGHPVATNRVLNCTFSGVTDPLLRPTDVDGRDSEKNRIAAVARLT
jgi:hypothetical protein